MTAVVLVTCLHDNVRSSVLRRRRFSNWRDSIPSFSSLSIMDGNMTSSRFFVLTTPLWPPEVDKAVTDLWSSQKICIIASSIVAYRTVTVTSARIWRPSSAGCSPDKTCSSSAPMISFYSDGLWSPIRLDGFQLSDCGHGDLCTSDDPDREC